MGTQEKAGIEGQNYQNKRTKKVCVLESQDTTRKTVMLRDADGKSVAQTFATFKRDWVAYNGEKAVKTSAQKTEETREQEKVEKKKEAAKKEEAKKKVEVKSKNGRVVEDKEAVAADVKTIIDTINAEAAKKKFEVFSTNVKRDGKCVVAKTGNRTLFEVWVKHEKDKSFICTRPVIYSKVKFAPSLEHITNENWTLPEVTYVPMKNMPAAIKAIVSVLDEFTKAPDKSERVPKINKPVPKKKK